jgi:transglutaminase-like putative cysteine protease
MAFLVLLGGLAIGPNLPGAEDSPLLNWRETKKRRPSSRVTVSPLVDIRSRLVQPSGAEVFTVRSDVASYWRLTSLDRFDGSIWSSLGSYRAASERLPSDIAAGDAVELVEQQFEIRALSSIWLPAAYQPERLEGPPGVRYDRDSSSLLTDAASSDGLRYRVSSTQRRPTADDLRLASPTVPDDVRGRYLALPVNFSERVRALAAEVAGPSGPVRAGDTGVNATPFEAARALQDWFRSSFTYDLNVPAGHDEGAIERFLFDVKRGYCEQFAGAYAAMARSLGLPARVAVGFTPGQTTGDGLFRVTDANAHAWPEVYIAGFGWTAFEPTPNRSVPGGESYTGVGVPPPGQETVPTTVSGAAQTAPAPTAPAPDPGDDQAVETNESDAGESGPRGRVVAAGAILLAAGLYAGGVPLSRTLLRARRRTAAVAGEDRVLLAWHEAQEDLALAGLPRRRHETAAEYAERAATDRALFAGSAPGAAEALGQLAADFSVAAFAPTGAHDDVARRAETAAATIHEVVRERATPWQKVKWALDPRPLRVLACGAYSSFLKRLRRRLPASPK